MTTDQQPRPAHSVASVAFDWGGVFTIGTFDGRSTARLAEQTGADVALVRQSYFRHVQQLEVGAWTLPQFWQIMQQETGITLPYADFEALYLGSIYDNEPMYALLRRLPPSVRVGLLSNNYPVVSDHLRARPAFARFDALVFSNEIHAKKPDRQAFEALEQAMQRPASQVAFVDDVQENIDAANRYGLYGLLYAPERHADFEAALGEWLGIPLGE